MILRLHMLFIFIFLHSSVFGQVEICDNGVDDDLDNLIDLNDDDCICQMATAASLIPNPSFEEMDCCPADKSQLFCASDWAQASTPTSDFIHLCGWSGVKEYPPPTPFPDGEGILGFRDGRVSSVDSLDALWKEYAGACLLSPMKANTAYRFQFDIGFVNPQISPPLNVTLFGTTSCDYLPFGIGDEAFGCPSNSPDWIKLGEIPVSGGLGDSWVKTFIDIIPNADIHAIALGPDCEPRPSSNVIYYYLDDLFLIDIASLDLQITSIVDPCTQDFYLSVPDNSAFAYQWYLSGVAINGETNSELKQAYGEGSYQVTILSGSSCRVSPSYEYTIPLFYRSDTLAICKGESYSFGALDLTNSGSYIDTFQSQFNCDSIVTLQLEVIGEVSDTIEMRIAPGETIDFKGMSYTEEGEYSISTPSSLGCDSLLLLRLFQFKIFIPNIFSPNNDGVNDLFRPIPAPNEVASYDMKIFNRWGNLIYQGDAWDGSDELTDVFVYVIEVEFISGASNTFQGSLTLLR